MNENWKKPKRGVVFAPRRGGRLIYFSSKSIRVYRLDPPNAYVKTAEQGWRHSRGTREADVNFRAMSGYVARYASRRRAGEQDRERLAGAYWAFLQSIPEPTRRILRAVRMGGWRFYTALVRCPGILELAAGGGLALSYALAHLGVFLGRRCPQQPLRAVRAMVIKPRKIIAQRLGFGGTASSVKILSRVAALSCTVGNLVLLREIIKDKKALKQLRHLPRINEGVIRLLASTISSNVTADFLFETARDVSLDGHDSHELLYRVRRVVTAHQCGHLVLRSHEHLDRIFGGPPPSSLVAEFAPPPLPGAPGIEPCSSPKMVGALSRELSNCLRGDHWLERIGSGTAYIYRICHAGEVSALSVVKRAGFWHRESHLGPNNTSPSPAATARVDQWLQGVQPDLPPRTRDEKRAIRLVVNDDGLPF